MKFLMVCLISLMLSSCVSHQNREPKNFGLKKKQLMMVNPSVCEEAINIDQLDFGRVKIGSKVPEKSIIVASTSEVEVKNINIYGLQLPFIFATGLGDTSDKYSNCKLLKNADYCEVKLSMRPIAIGSFEDHIIINFKANGEICGKKIRLLAEGVN